MQSVTERPAVSTPRAAIYDRVSTRPQKEHGFSLDAQEKDTREYAERLGAVVVHHWTDNDSGADWNLPGLNALLDAARRREFDVLVVYAPDRLARNMAKQLVVEQELRRAGVQIHYARYRIEDTAEGRLLKNQLASFAEYEREKTQFLTMRGKREKAERGLVVGSGLPPYGYRFVRNDRSKPIGLEPDPVTAPVVQRIFRDLLHSSTNQIADQLVSEGIPGPRGKPWHTAAVYRIGRHPSYVGVWIYGAHHQWIHPDAEGPFTKVPIPPLVDRSLWDDVQRALQQRTTSRHGRRPEAEDDFILRGLLTCSHCGGAISTHWNNHVRYYGCKRAYPSRARIQRKALCPSKWLLAEALEAHVWELVSATLLDPDHLAQGLSAARQEHDEAERRWRERLEIVDTEIDRQRGQLDRLVRRLTDAEPGGELEQAIKRQASEIEQTIGRLKTERVSLAGVRVEGLSAEEALSLQQFAAEVREGVNAAEPSDRRRIYKLLQIQGSVRTDPHGDIRLGRFHRYRLDWRAKIELVSGKSPLSTGIST